MPVEVKRKNSESLESLLRRFSKKMQRSGVLFRAKKGRYYHRPENKRQRKDRALRRAKILKQKEELKKLGKLEELIPTKTQQQKISKVRKHTTLPSAKAEAQRYNSKV